jgi:hypothetical protein
MWFVFSMNTMLNMAKKAWLVALQIWTYLCNTPNILFQNLKKKSFQGGFAWERDNAWSSSRHMLEHYMSWELGTKL